MTPAVKDVVLRGNPRLSTLVGLPGLQAYYDALVANSVAVDAVGRTSQWNDLSGFGHHLLQGTQGNQPIYLRWSGANYIRMGTGVTGNHVSTPDSTALHGPDQVEQIFQLSMDSWAPGSDQVLSALNNNGTLISGLLRIRSAGNLYWQASLNGGTSINYIGGTNVGFSAGTTNWIKFQATANNGSSQSQVKFFTSSDGVNYTQLGTTVTSATFGTFDVAGGGGWWIGENITSSSNSTAVRYYYAEHRTTIGGNAVAVMNPTQTVDGSTSWASPTGETWTVHQSGGTPALIVGKPSVLFDGSAFNLRVALTLAQPIYFILVGRQLAWSDTNCILDFTAGGAVGQIQFRQTVLSSGVSPQVGIAVAGGANNVLLKTWTLGSMAIISGVTNTDAIGSLLQLNNTAPAQAVSTGGSTGGGVTMGARWNNTLADRFSNVQISALAVFTVAPTQPQIRSVVKYFGARYGIAV